MAAESGDPRSRFSSRVGAYVKYRPGYPPAVTGLFRQEMALARSSVIADVGSGTGLSAEPFLRAGNTVFCVEPNAAMRQAAERWLGGFAGFHSIDGSAEATGLPDRSVDLVLCAQAFHWFDRDRARSEFARITRPGGFVVLMWNARKKRGSAFLEGYESLLMRYGTDYSRVDHEAITGDEIRAFLGPGMRLAAFPHEQRFDLDGLRGRVASSSYTPAAGQAGHGELMAGLDELFARSSADGRVVFEYDTKVYWAPAGATGS
jgi:SAM-dependent methyltransferase